MLIVNKRQVRSTVHGLLAEASDLGLRPGDWPDFISVVDDQNEGFIFQKSWPEYFHTDMVSYHYRTRNGHELIVLND